MNPSQIPARRETGAISSEALIGLGMTIGALGVLGLLLGWAQQMRGFGASSTLWLGVGAGCVVLGILIAAAARARKGR